MNLLRKFKNLIGITMPSQHIMVINADWVKKMIEQESLKNKGGVKMISNIEVKVTEKKVSPEVVYLEDGRIKAVFAPPYTHVELRRYGNIYKARATCNPEDTYDKFEGFRLAHERASKKWANGISSGSYQGSVKNPGKKSITVELGKEAAK